jgi:hypothetical protein
MIDHMGIPQKKSVSNFVSGFDRFRNIPPRKLNFVTAPRKPLNNQFTPHSNITMTDLLLGVLVSYNLAGSSPCGCPMLSMT